MLLNSIIVTILSAVLVLCNAASTSEPITRTVNKRGLSAYGDDFGAGFGGFAGFGFPPAAGNVLGPWALPPRSYGPSPAEVATLISNAKQASANVMIAQQQVQAAKDNVLNQQKIAMDKETSATILTQKSEAAAAIQRSEAAAAAQSVILAQQRLAQAKANAAHQQKIAAAKEAHAAAALQNSARAAAIEIQKTEHEASKFANLHRAGQGSAAFILSATKDAAFSPITAGTNHVPGLPTFGAWSTNALNGNGAVGGFPAWATGAPSNSHFGSGLGW